MQACIQQMLVRAASWYHGSAKLSGGATRARTVRRETFYAACTCTCTVPLALSGYAHAQIDTHVTIVTLTRATRGKSKIRSYSFLTRKYIFFMLFATFFSALAGFLSRCRPTRKRSRPKRRRVWRKRRYNFWLRPQRRQPQPRSKHAPTNDQGNLPVQPDTMSPREPSLLVEVVASHESPDANVQNMPETELTGTRPTSSDNLGVETQSSSSNNDIKPTQESASMHVLCGDTSVEDECVHRRDIAVEGECRISSGVVSSFKSVCDSEKFIQAASGVTEDSGFVETSLNSMKSCVDEDTSVPDQPKVTRPTHSSNVIEPEPCTPDITDKKEDGQILKKHCNDTDVEKGQMDLEDGQILDMPCNNTDTHMPCSDTDVEGGQILDNFCNNADLEDMTSDNDTTADTLSVVSDTSLVPNITSQELLEMNEVVDNDEGWCDAAICRVDSFQRTQSNRVSLEGMERSRDETMLVGTVVVRNECYVKDVFVRHSSNAWETFEDTAAEWTESLVGGTLDRFSFRVPLSEGSYSMELAFSFNEKNWDNNNGQNYSVTCTF